MKREIKFRAWHAGHKYAEPQMLYDEKPGDCLVWEAQGQNITQVMQYTGLKDRNGKEIYEGDIVRYPDAYMNGVDGDWDEVTCVGEIKWDDDQAQFYVTNRESIDNEDFWEAIDEAEVIGNRWDNPDLLEGEKI
ncbi:YopX family protein [Paenibacillus lautus]|uniref:YopX family protein n=1 Tax=Paenibacillus lautus TaxID=1401 RepID=UPI003850BD94